MKFIKRIASRVISGVLITCILIWLNPQGLRIFADNNMETIRFFTFFSNYPNVTKYNQTDFNLNFQCNIYDLPGTSVAPDTMKCYPSVGSGPQDNFIKIPYYTSLKFNANYTPQSSYNSNYRETLGSNESTFIIYLKNGGSDDFTVYGPGFTVNSVAKYWNAGNYNLVAYKVTNTKNYVESYTPKFGDLSSREMIPVYWGSLEGMPNYVRSLIGIKPIEQDTNEKLGDINQGIKDTNDTLKNDNVDGASGSAGGFFEGFETNFGGLTSIVTAPLVFINGLTASCNDLTLPIGIVAGNLTLPCAKNIYTTYFGPLYNIYVTLIDGLVAYFVVKGLFQLFQDMKDPSNSRVDVIDL